MKVIITHNEIQAWENDEQLGKIVFEVSNDKLLIGLCKKLQHGLKNKDIPSSPFALLQRNI